MKWSDGRKFEENWHNGKKNGLGILTTEEGEKKAGIFKRGNILQIIKEEKTDKIPQPP